MRPSWRLLAIALLFAWSSTISGDNQPLREMRTWGLSNGRAWVVLSREQRAAYVLGYLDAMSAADTPVADHVKKCHCTPDDIRQGVDKFYGDHAEYVRLPIAVAVGSFVGRATGTSEEEDRRSLSEMLAQLASQP